MSNHLFRFPATCPDLDFASLEAYIRAAYDGEELRRGDHAPIGTTVQVTYEDGLLAGVPMPPRITVELYGVRIAAVYRHAVYFCQHGDAHLATTEWIAKIVRDNAIGTSVGRIRRRKTDPLIAGPRGYAGPLAIGYDRNRLVEGYWYGTGDIDGQRRRNAERAAGLAADRERYAEESRRREALKTWTHPQYGPLYAIEGYALSHGYHWQIVDGSYFDTIGYIRDTRVGPDAPPYTASPEPDGKPVFTAFAGGPEHRQDALGAFRTVADAIAAVAGAENDTLVALTAIRTRQDRVLTDAGLDDVRPGLALDVAQLRKAGMDEPGDYLASTYEDRS